MQGKTGVRGEDCGRYTPDNGVGRIPSGTPSQVHHIWIVTLLIGVR